MLGRFVAIALAFAATVHAVPQPLEVEGRQTLAQVVTACTAPGRLAALTFDDGPSQYLDEVVNQLNAAGAKGTFFFNGNNFGCIYSRQAAIKRAFNAGHQVASHTWAHKHLPTLTWDQIHDEMWRVEQALIRIVGANPAFMRPPYGEYNNLVRQASAVRGQTLVNWDFDSGDSTGSTAQQSINAYASKISQNPRTILALNHDVQVNTVRVVLPEAIRRLKAAGYTLVTVAQCLGRQPYQSTAAPQTPSPSWTC